MLNTALLTNQLSLPLNLENSMSENDIKAVPLYCDLVTDPGPMQELTTTNTFSGNALQSCPLMLQNN